ncbi:MAG: acetylglutamate kinase [Enterococcus sp.]
MEETIVLKIGGVASDNLTAAFFEQISKWQVLGKRVIVVHGGGHYVTEMMQILSQEVQTKNGLRVTDSKALETTRMVLLGKVQPLIMTAFQKHGLAAVGLNAGCDRLIEGQVKDFEKLGFVGEVTKVNELLINQLSAKKHIPVIAPLGITKEGQWLNINADDVACGIAQAIQADKLYLMTDVPGVQIDGHWIDEMAVSAIAKGIEKGSITGGMIPKLLGAKNAIEQSVKKVIITNDLLHPGTEISAVIDAAIAS